METEDKTQNGRGERLVVFPKGAGEKQRRDDGTDGSPVDSVLDITCVQAAIRLTDLHVRQAQVREGRTLSFSPNPVHSEFEKMSYPPLHSLSFSYLYKTRVVLIGW